MHNSEYKSSEAVFSEKLKLKRTSLLYTRVKIERNMLSEKKKKKFYEVLKKFGINLIKFYLKKNKIKNFKNYASTNVK